jgi:hypothetical protein
MPVVIADPLASTVAAVAASVAAPAAAPVAAPVAPLASTVAAVAASVAAPAAASVAATAATAPIIAPPHNVFTATTIAASHLKKKKKKHEDKSKNATIAVAASTSTSTSTGNNAITATTVTGNSAAAATISNTASATTESCKEYYIKNNNSKKALLAMCLGVDPTNNKFGDPDEDDVYKAPPPAFKKNSFAPSAKELKVEAICRNRSFDSSSKELKCSSWLKPRLKEWLLQHPITCAIDIRFIKEKEKEFRNQLLDAAKERDAQQELHASIAQEAWVGPVPWLRLGHAIVDDDVLTSYRNIHKWQDHAATDACNSSSRPKSFEELCASKYNDPSSQPTTECYPELHDDYREEIDLGSDFPFVTPDKIKTKVAEFRANIVKMISDWETSGNGCGQRAPDSKKFGHIRRDQQWLAPRGSVDEFVDGNNRKSFLNGKGVHLLYLWQLLDEHDLLYHTMSVIPPEYGAGVNGVSMTQGAGAVAASRRETEQKEAAEHRKNQKKIGSSLSSLAASSARLAASQEQLGLDRANVNLYQE